MVSQYTSRTHEQFCDIFRTVNSALTAVTAISLPKAGSTMRKRRNTFSTSPFKPLTVILDTVRYCQPFHKRFSLSLSAVFLNELIISLLGVQILGLVLFFGTRNLNFFDLQSLVDVTPPLFLPQQYILPWFLL